MLGTPKDITDNYATMGIIGASGTYKTLLASLAPHAYFIDADNGAAHTGCYRMRHIPTDTTGFGMIKKEIAKLAQLQPGPDGLLTHQVDGVEFKIGAVVIDTLDKVQTLASLSIANLKRDKFKYYGRLKEMIQQDIIYPLQRINAHVIVVNHTKLRTADSEAKAAGETDTVSLLLEGSVRDTFFDWFDVVLHIVQRRTDRVMLTQPTFVGPRHLMAKDRYHVFGGEEYILKIKDGKPQASLMEMVLARTSGGVKSTQVTGMRNMVKEAWVAAAKAKGILGNEPTPTEFKVLKGVLVGIYDEVATMTDGFGDIEIAGLNKIEEYEVKK